MVITEDYRLLESERNLNVKSSVQSAKKSLPKPKAATKSEVQSPKITSQDSVELTQPDPQLDLYSYSARNPRITASGVALSTLVSTAVPGVLAGVAAANLPGLSPITKGALEMFSAFSVMGSVASASWAYSKAKAKFRQRGRNVMTAKLQEPDIKDRGSVFSTSKSLAGHAVKGSLLGIGAAGLAATGLELAARSVLPENWVPGVVSAGFTYLGMATLTHNALNAELGHRWT